jgi:drug/metabolite transporter (DMT)-like permease
LLPFYLKASPASYFIPTWADAAWLIILAVVCTVLCFDLQLKALQKISAFTCNLMYNLEPVYGIILAFIFFGEGKMFKNEFYLGLLLIMLALFLQVMRLRQQFAAKKE